MIAIPTLPWAHKPLAFCRTLEKHQDPVPLHQFLLQGHDQRACITQHACLLVYLHDDQSDLRLVGGGPDGLRRLVQYRLGQEHVHHEGRKGTCEADALHVGRHGQLKVFFPHVYPIGMRGDGVVGLFGKQLPVEPSLFGFEESVEGGEVS